MSGQDSAERERLLFQAMEQVARDEAAVREREARRRFKNRKGLLIGSATAFTLVVAWNAWLVLRSPPVPPEQEQICALMRTAGAVGQEALGVRATGRRLPTAQEIVYLLDGRLTYRVDGERFAVAHTDGVHTVIYDGTRPVNEWMAAAGCAEDGSVAR